MPIKKLPKSLEIKEKRNPFKSKLSPIALALTILLSGQSSNAENLSSNSPKIEKIVKQTDISWIRKGIKSTKDIEKLNRIINELDRRVPLDKNGNLAIDKFSFQEKMLVFNSLINQYKLIKQKFEKNPNEFLNHLKKSKVDLAVMQALYSLLGRYNGEIDGENIANFEPITDKDINTIALFVFYMKNIEAEKFNLPKPYKIRPELEDLRSEKIFYYYYNMENPDEIKNKKDSIVLNLMKNLLPTEIQLIFAEPKTLCSNEPDEINKYEYCLDGKLSEEELNEFYHYAFPIADALDNLFGITKHPEKFKETVLLK